MLWVLFSLANVILRPFGVSLYVKPRLRASPANWMAGTTVEPFGDVPVSALMRHVSTSSDGQEPASDDRPHTFTAALDRIAKDQPGVSDAHVVTTGGKKRSIEVKLKRLAERRGDVAKAGTAGPHDDRPRGSAER